MENLERQKESSLLLFANCKSNHYGYWGSHNVNGFCKLYMQSWNLKKKKKNKPQKKKKRQWKITWISNHHHPARLGGRTSGRIGGSQKRAKIPLLRNSCLTHHFVLIFIHRSRMHVHHGGIQVGASGVSAHEEVQVGY